ncbi:hypothetical protein [Caloranaerobacter azorensis]|uniref:Uncharacterized protein n=1 Tax=Caloranaerobacter azorensis TaxID=116090 RepID=A0A6P1YEI2_9FIRM|nr:hypothetical protein [Caloranaerobacter azorensis]QIB27641.1 hypothetical protein G3A45_10280 [Caloranaerobacter azorensis]
MDKCTEICISCYKYKINDNFLKRLVIILGPVLMGSKSSELLSFPKHDKYLLDKIEIIKNIYETVRELNINCLKLKMKI